MPLVWDQRLISLHATDQIRALGLTINGARLRLRKGILCLILIVHLNPTARACSSSSPKRQIWQHSAPTADIAGKHPISRPHARIPTPYGSICTRDHSDLFGSNIPKLTWCRGSLPWRKQPCTMQTPLRIPYDAKGLPRPTNLEEPSCVPVILPDRTPKAEMRRAWTACCSSFSLDDSISLPLRDAFS
jgi:hypothetical protein